MARSHIQAISFLLDTNFSDHMGTNSKTSPRKLEIFEFRAPSRTLFDMDSRAGYSWNRQKDRCPKSTISVTDLCRKCTALKLRVSQWGRSISRQYVFPMGPKFPRTWGPATLIFPRKLEIRQVRTPNRTLSKWILGREIQWGRRKVLVPKLTISVTD